MRSENKLHERNLPASLGTSMGHGRWSLGTLGAKKRVWEGGWVVKLRNKNITSQFAGVGICIN